MSPLNISSGLMASISARTNILIGKDGNIPVDIITFHGLRDDKEHIALVFNKNDEDIAPLVRLHSECLTRGVSNHLGVIVETS